MPINPNLFNKKVTFGRFDEGAYDLNGNQTRTFVTTTTVWCGDQTQSLSQQYTLLGSGITDTRLIAIRHRKLAGRGTVAQIDGTFYDIVNVSPDNRIGLDTFDLVTLKENVKL